MSGRCVCKVCRCPIDCGETLCPRCENNYPNEPKECSNGHCDIQLEEVKAGVFKFKRADGTFYLQRRRD